MRRRLFGLLLALVLAAVLLPAAAAGAAPTTGSDDVLAPGSDGTLVLAVEGGGEGEAPGLEPMGPDETENPAAPQDYEANFLWGAAIGLLVLVVIGVLAVGALYYLLVYRPRQLSDQK